MYKVATSDSVIDKLTSFRDKFSTRAAGMGRAGTVLACYLVKYQKYSAKDAIEKVRTKRPGSIQSEVQELAIQLYEKHTSN